MKNSVFLNIGDLSCGCTDHVLGEIAKAISGENGKGDIWSPHESPFERSLIELFTSRGLMQLEKVRDELNAWIAGKRYIANGTSVDGLPVLTPGRLDANELALVRIYLENLPPDQLKASDWALLVDYLVSRYMPPTKAYSEAEWLAVRSTFMGKVQAQLGNVTQEQADGILAMLPTTIAAAKEIFRPALAVEGLLDYGYQRCADNVEALGETTRHRLKQVIMAHEEQRMLGANPPRAALQTQLFDEFSSLNRDWRRIALTEVAENAGQGLIASLKPGTRVKRVEQYVGACPFCRKINGLIFTVVPADKKDKDWNTEVWAGKTNIGRSGAKMRRTDDGLVARTDAEMWKVPAGPVHPHCRGIWLVLEDAKPTDDPAFAKWLDGHFAKHRKTAEQHAKESREALRGPSES